MSGEEEFSSLLTIDPCSEHHRQVVT